MFRLFRAHPGRELLPTARHDQILPESALRPEEQRENNKLQKILFEGTSQLTRRFPRAGSRFLDLTFRPMVGNLLLSALFTRHNRRVVRGVKSFRRFLVIPDIHIGDAVMSQSALTALRDFFPEAEVDYVVNKTAYPLIEGNPEATRVLPFFSNGFFPSSANLLALRTMIKSWRYDLILNFCPYIKDKDIMFNGNGILNFLTYAPTIVRNERQLFPINHFAYQTYRFTRDLLSLVAKPGREEQFKGLRLTLDDSAVEQALWFASDAGLSPDVPVIMFNPDAASLFTLMPFDKQADLLGHLAQSKASILLGAGHSEAGIGERLNASLPLNSCARVKIIPTKLSLEAYSALIDFCDVFISGDTGPLHLAAARRYSRSGRYVFRNRTAVMGLFGATPSRMSGYDSFQPGYLPANQDAPSWSYTAGSPCRNITCLNKMYKTCRTVRCFEEVDMEGLAGRIMTYLQGLANRLPERREPATI